MTVGGFAMALSSFAPGCSRPSFLLLAFDAACGRPCFNLRQYLLRFLPTLRTMNRRAKWDVGIVTSMAECPIGNRNS